MGWWYITSGIQGNFPAHREHKENNVIVLKPYLGASHKLLQKHNEVIGEPGFNVAEFFLENPLEFGQWLHLNKFIYSNEIAT